MIVVSHSNSSVSLEKQAKDINRQITKEVEMTSKQMKSPISY